jgi:hypothetical protein
LFEKQNTNTQNTCWRFGTATNQKKKKKKIKKKKKKEISQQANSSVYTFCFVEQKQHNHCSRHCVSELFFCNTPSFKGQEMGRAPNDCLLQARASPKAKVVQTTVQKSKRTGVHRLGKRVFDDFTAFARKSGNSRRIPYFQILKQTKQIAFTTHQTCVSTVSRNVTKREYLQKTIRIVQKNKVQENRTLHLP